MHRNVWILLAAVFGVNVLDALDCTLRDQAIGECRLEHECPEFVNNIQNRFGQPSVPIRCGRETICCRKSSTESSTEEESPRSTSTQMPAAVVTRPTPKRKPNPGLSRKPSAGKERKAVAVCNEYIAKKQYAFNKQILNGLPVELGEFPHMAALGYPDDDKGLRFDCGGTLISEWFVLTAAHCLVNPADLLPTVARIGVVLLDGNDTDKTDYLVADHIKHESYNHNLRQYDIALLRLSRIVDFSTLVYPACLNSDGQIPDPGTTLSIAGWGTINRSSKESNNALLKAEVAAVATPECNRVFNNSIFRETNPTGYLPSQLCAKDWKIVRSDTCPGDSGGPLQMALEMKDLFSVVGITSFGRPCGTDAPGVYTRISSFVDWIEQKVWP